MTPFANSSEHLLAELERVDLMIRSRVAHARQVHAQDENFNGLYISEAEVDGLLERTLGAPTWLQESARSRLDGVDAALQRVAADIAARRRASIDAGVDLRLDTVARTFGLDAFDVDVLLVCLAVELDLRYERLYAYLQDDVTKKRPSVDLAIKLLCAAPADGVELRRHFHARAPLVAHRLVALVEDPAQAQAPLLALALKLDDRVVQFLLGGDDIDPALARGVQAVAPARTLDDLLLEDDARSALRESWSGTDGGAPPLLLHGLDGSGKRAIAEALCGEHGVPLLVADLAQLALQADDADAVASWAALVGRVEREAALRGAVVLWHHLQALTLADQRPSRAAFLRAVDAGQAPCILASSAAADLEGALPLLRRGAIVVRTPEPTHAQRVSFWRGALHGAALDDAVDLDGLAGRFSLSFGRMREVADTVRRRAAARRGAPAITMRDLLDSCRLHSNQRLSRLALKTSTNYRWNDIVLPADRLAQLHELCDHVRFRDVVYEDWGFGRKLSLGKGLAVLFAGPSGTGKTMSAGIIAAELGLDLYKIDLSSIVSKYIGETEKNLARIFDEAESSNAILFFDEADALFGKRSEVRDSHDRYANIEVGYLLQRIEEYSGVIILATNFRKNLDDAFVRRLRFIVEFPFPDREDRARIWNGIWPREVKRDAALDADLLAGRYELTGGNIKNIALAAAFLAAGDDGKVSMRHVAHAAAREFQKTGKLISDDSGLAFVHSRQAAS